MTVTCEPHVFVPTDRTHTLVNPQVVIEVLSASPAQEDWSVKRADYFSIDTLRE